MWKWNAGGGGTKTTEFIIEEEIHDTSTGSSSLSFASRPVVERARELSPPAGNRKQIEPVTMVRSRMSEAATPIQVVPSTASACCSEEGPARYRHIEDIMRDARRVELDECVELAMLVEGEEPSCYREAVGQSAWE